MSENFPVKFILKGVLKLVSPMSIGSGEHSNSDSDVLLDRHGNPFIPATSINGVVRSFFRENNWDDDYFFGFCRKNTTNQSKICFYDLHLSKNQTGEIALRDGIMIKNRSANVENKFDYEIVNKDSRFDLEILFNSCKNEAEKMEQAVVTIRDLLKNNLLSFGGRTNNGLGKVVLESHCIYRYDFANKVDFIRWLGRNDTRQSEIQPTAKAFVSQRNRLKVLFHGKLKDSMIIRSYSNKPEEPDSVHIRSANDLVIPGSSFKGALRSRAERIALTLGKSNDLISDLFGFVKVHKRSENARKGRLQVSETILPEMTSEIQHRIKIDRFTGGTVNSALFDSKPIFEDSGKTNQFEITVKNPRQEDLGLLLLVLKDLWCGDLAVGGEKNVGRGVFDGQTIDLEYYEPGKLRKFRITNNGSGSAPAIEGEKQFLEECVEKFVKMGERHE